MTEAILVLGGIIAGAALMELARWASGVFEERRAETARASKERMEGLKRMGSPTMAESASRAMWDAAKAEARADKAEAQLKDAWAEIDQLKDDIRFNMVKKGELGGPTPGEVLIDETQSSEVKSLSPSAGVRVLRETPHWSACCKHCRNTFDVAQVRRETHD